ncbi:chemotaxis protein methyltransferase CheR [Steroidobacter denitrificans]|uniref:Chemotaxis protein methyltransferase n=1 Tax=Steroidobacter denitrificans TaxID=465721 RepID=A0A127FDV9_STEDE|nr:chemotaxis protein methyltransferase CheR [Steroidobacter denitrificans]
MERNGAEFRFSATSLTQAEFERIKALAFRLAGINLSQAKKSLIVGRWNRRLQHYRLGSFSEYLDLLSQPEARGELQTALNLLTTNETNYFRERQHFDFLRERVLPKARQQGRFRVWSAACSSGEEPYSIAMLLAAELGNVPWEVLGSDISTSVLTTARDGIYAMERARPIPQEYLHRYCLKGTGPQAGTFRVDRAIRERVQFRYINLNEPLPDIGVFDVILLRNVMIYFSAETKSQVVTRMLPALTADGHFLVGHCETLNGVTDRLAMSTASIYTRASRCA